MGEGTDEIKRKLSQIASTAVAQQLDEPPTPKAVVLATDRFAPSVAPTPVQTSHFQSITGNLGDLSVLVAGVAEVPETREIRGFLECGREDLNLQGVAPTRPST